MLKKLLCVTVVLTLCYTLSGCAVYNAAVDERNISEQYSDTVITTTILKKIVKSKTISALDVSVNTFNGKVYLVGEVDSLAQRNTAISTARNTKGVQEVVPYLLLKNEQDFCGTTDNLTMNAQLKKALIGDKEIWSTNVSTDVVQCNIILTGIVGTTKEKQKIIQHARAVPKVRSVTSYIQVQ
ncbi:BON domain-containing protein [Halodesulfovibrio aestuarii]|uniref:BON domain-containing protein n=1 Tax=Halodesulfovibrio aestuarii TaxID=126333 RepID=A0ABV4JN41_9BACT